MPPANAGEDLGLSDDEVAFYDALAPTTAPLKPRVTPSSTDRRRTHHPGEKERVDRLTPRESARAKIR